MSDPAFFYIKFKYFISYIITLQNKTLQNCFQTINILKNQKYYHIETKFKILCKN